MNELARIVHDRITGQGVTRTNLLSHLSAEERAALEDLNSLLQHTPAELAAFLAHGQLAVDWFTRQSRRSQIRA